MSSIALPDPESSVLERRDAIVKDLVAIAGAGAVIADEDGRRAYETDAFTAYKRMPLAVVLPETTESVAAVLGYCHANGIKVVPRGAGTSLCGGALPAEDAIVIGVSRMNNVLEVDTVARFARVQTGITNLAISAAVGPSGFFYAPDPSSQLACTIAGNIAMNSGGAHCLKYGVTTNNVLGVKMVLMDGTVVEIGGAHLDARRLRPPRARHRVGRPARHRHGSDGAHSAPGGGRAADADRFRIRRRRPASACRGSSRPASCRWRSNSWTGRRSRCARRSPRPAIRWTSKRC